MRDALETVVPRALPGLSVEHASELVVIIERLVEALQPERIYVFGSHARGDAAPDSDVDLMVVVPYSDLLPHNRDQAAYRSIGLHAFAVDVLVLTAAEFKRTCGAYASLPATVLREGKVIYAA